MNRPLAQGMCRTPGGTAALLLAAFLTAQTRPAHAASAWPADAGTSIGGGLPEGYEPSGVVWHKGLKKLFLVSDEGWISRMNLDGSGITTWHVESADYEGITVADHASNRVYVATEKKRILIKEFDVSSGALTGKTWRLTEMEGSKNAGLEAITFVPNGFHPYADSSSGGLFYAGKEADGKIYVYDVNLSVSGSATYKGTITPVAGRTAIGGLHFEPDTGVLYVLYRDDALVLEITPSGTHLAEYSRPNRHQEGITLIPSCPASTADMVLACDNGPVTLYRNYPVSCLGGAGAERPARLRLRHAGCGPGGGPAPRPSPGGSPARANSARPTRRTPP